MRIDHHARQRFSCAHAALVVAIFTLLASAFVGPVAAQEEAEPAATIAEEGADSQGAEPAADPAEPATEEPETADPATADPAATEAEPAEPEPAADPIDPPAATSDPAVQIPDLKAEENVDLVFKFRYAPWKDVLEWFADEADLSLVYEALPAGTFNYTDTHSYSPAEAIDLINSVLLTKGYTLVRHRRMLILINLQDGIPPNLVSEVKAEELDERGTYELVSVLFSVTRMPPDEMEIEISKLLGPQGKVIVLPQAKRILVTETAGRLKTIRDVIEAIENPPAASDSEVSVFTLEHITADEAMIVARPLLGIPEGQNVAPDESLRVSLDPLGGRMLVNGDEETVAKLENILKLVDVPSGAAGATVIETPQLEVYSVGTSDPAGALRVMQTLLAGEPDVRIEIDEATGNLVVLARPSHHATVRATLDQMTRDGREVEVIQLAYVDPQIAMLSINKLFGGGEEASASAPKVEADPLTGQLLIRGSKAQIEQIRGMLQKMGETGEGPATLADGVRSNVRTINLSGFGASSALEQLQSLWPSVRQNRIRVVTPSSSIREMRPSGLDERLPSENGGPGRIDSDDPTLELFRLFQFNDAVPTDRPLNVPERTQPQSPLPSQEQPADFDPFDIRPRNNAPAAEEADDRQTNSQSIPRRVQATFAQAVFQPAEEAPSAGSQQPPPAATAPNGGSQPAPMPTEPESVPGADIIVAPGPNGIVIASDDLDALDQFESLLRLIGEQAAAAANQHTVFYLKYAEAPAAASLLREVLGVGGGDSGGGGGGGGLLGNLAGAALGGGGDIFGDLLGLGGGGGLTTSTSLSIVADTRLNALIVQGSPEDVDLIEQMLQIIDQENSPEDVETIAKPRLIPVFNTNASDIATVVQQIYAQRIASTGGGQQRQPSPEEFIQALRGGGNRRGGNSQAAEQQKMTIGVDARSNSIIVAAPDPLFEQVKALVEQLDAAGEQSDQTVRVLQLNRSTPEVMQKALESVLGDQVQTSTTSNGSNNSSNDNGGDDAARRSEEFRNQLRQRFEAFNQLQQGGGGRGGQGGGGRGGPGGGRGGR